MNKINIKMFVPLFVVFVLIYGEISAQTELEKKIDSLFVIASSGELRYRDLTEPAMDSVAALGAPAVPWLVDKFSTKSARERWTIIWILQRIGSEAVPYLVTSLNRNDPLIVSRVCWALGDIKDSSAVMPLMNISNHNNWKVRDQALGALGKIGDSQANDVVVSFLTDTIGQVRKSAVVSCGKLAVENSIRDLINCFADDFYGARLEAVNSLLKLDSNVVLSAAADSINSQRTIVGNLCCYLLGEIGNDDAIEILSEQALNSSISGRKAHAATAIIKADPNDHCGLQSKLLEDDGDRLTLIKIESAIKTSKISDE